MLVAGIEAHVCVLQSALGLADAGFAVAVAADAVASRKDSDRDRALDRMAANGVEVMTSEMAIFEWLHTAGDPNFRAVSALVK